MTRNQFSITSQIMDANLKQSHGTTPTEKLVLLSLSRFLGDKEKKNVFTCYPSQRTLADKACCSTVAVNRALKKFEELGFIKSCYRTTLHGGSTSKLYTWIGIPKLKEKETEELSAEVKPNNAETLESLTDNGSKSESSHILSGCTVSTVNPNSVQAQHTNSSWWDDFVSEELETRESPF
ncbi:helix-turn-helix domain-containing protein [Vibrio alginolyticus]|uniref:helix-turn-helix domain-containing protein n=1 Tax=Vibrio alginolyticus TaxID=663 RepID=UPI003D7D8ABA